MNILQMAIVYVTYCLHDIMQNSARGITWHREGQSSVEAFAVKFWATVKLSILLKVCTTNFNCMRDYMRDYMRACVRDFVHGCVCT